MDDAAMKTTMTAVALVLALGSSAYAQEVKPSITPAAPAATTVPAVKPAETMQKPVLAPETMQKVGAPTSPAAPAAPAAAVTAPKVEAKPAMTPTAAPTASTPAAAPAVTAPTKTAAPAAAVKMLNINTVSAADLEKLPKIGEARAKLIVAGRPYKSVDDLTAKKIIPQDAFDAVKGLISTQ
jgi:competence protein ComEA